MFAFLTRNVHNPEANFFAEKNNGLLMEERSEFQKFMMKHGRNYATKEEYAYRFTVFVSMYNRIKTHNAKFVDEMGFEMEVNKFSDLTEAEFKKHTGFIHVPKDDDNEVPEGIEEEVPNGSVDWRSKGAVTAVKD